MKTHTEARHTSTITPGRNHQTGTVSLDPLRWVIPYRCQGMHQEAPSMRLSRGPHVGRTLMKGARADVIADNIKAPVAAPAPSRHRNGFQQRAKGFW
jgi:hypothetical protein